MTVSAPGALDDAGPAGACELPVVELRGIGLHAITERVCIDTMMRALDRGRGGWVVTPNLDFLRRAERDGEFRAMIECADLLIPDGMPLIWASRLQRTPLPERVPGSTLITNLCAAAGRASRSVYLLGGMPGTADGAAEILARLCPGLRIAGTRCPPLGFEQDEEEMSAIARDLVATQPDIVFVALGSPKQELFIRRLRDHLPAAWWLGIGISFSFLTGDVKRAPLWMQRLGLEWLHRLLQQPRALARRYLIDGLPFAARLLGGSALRGLRVTPGSPSHPRPKTDAGSRPADRGT